MMRLTFALCFLLCRSVLFSQVDAVVYKWDDLMRIQHNPDTIYHISFKKNNLNALPKELFAYSNLISLDLSKNHLLELSDSITLLTKLERIDLERNKLDRFPLVFCRMPNMRSINLGMNNIENVPVCIEGIARLKELLLYDNPISNLPQELSNLRELKTLDLSGIRFSPEFQKVWTERLPEVTILFDAPCDCMK